MLETVDFSQADMPKDEYKRVYKELIERLVVLQQQARQQGVGLVVLFEGWNGAGKGSRISDLMYNLDARATSVHVTSNLNVSEARSFAKQGQGVAGPLPPIQEFWRALGERGTITFYDRGWYTAAMQRVLYNLFGSLSLPKNLEKRIVKAAKTGIDEQRVQAVRAYAASIAEFERQIADDGYIVVKFFVHMTKKGRKERLERLREDPATAWRVSEEKLASIGDYEEAYVIYDRLLEGSNFSYAPWTVLNGERKRRTNVEVAKTLVSVLEAALDARRAPAEGNPETAAAGEAERAAASEPSKAACEPERAAGEPSKAAGGECVSSEAGECEGGRSGKAAELMEEKARSQALCAPRSSRVCIMENYPSLDSVDHTLSLDEETYRKRLKKLQKKLSELECEMFQKRIPLVAMFEGWDAAGKGGSIKRIAQALDARAYTIFPSPAPTRPELLHPHLWRYWTRLPKAGHMGIYDRSWYGRVLVERVEGFATTEQWARAYDEINAFERDLVEWGAVLLKFWVDVSPEEQLRRFHARQNDPAKQWKITDEDWRNRDKYPLYKTAVEDMFRLTSTTFAPWVILESDDKRYARIKALETLVSALEKRLG